MAPTQQQIPAVSVTDLVGLLWQRHRWHVLFGIVLAAAAIVLGLAGLQAVRADSAPSSFVAITPTRVLDTRIAAGLPGALTSAQPQTLDVTGSIPVVLPGDQLSTGSPVPDGATAIVANVTIVGPTTPGFVAVRPGTATGNPTTSSLNATTSGIVLPNSVTVELPTTGANAGQIQLWYQGTTPTATTHLLIDIVGYYTATGAAGAADLAALQAQVTALQGQVNALTTTLNGVARSGNTLRFSGMNIQVVNGSGSTHGTPNGLGNLIVGYNSDDQSDGQLEVRTGSHNVVIGNNHTYTSTGGSVGGEDGRISNAGAVVITGRGNESNGLHAAVVTGDFNTASNARSVVVSGVLNTASGLQSTVVSGQSNIANGASSAILGGFNNTFVTNNGVEDTIVGGDNIATCNQGNSSTTCGEGSITAAD